MTGAGATSRVSRAMISRSMVRASRLSISDFKPR